MGSPNSLKYLILLPERLYYPWKRRLLMSKTIRRHTRPRLILGRTARKDYWAGRLFRESAVALRILDSGGLDSLEEYLRVRGMADSTRRDRQRAVIESMRLIVSPAAAKRFDGSASICVDGQFHLFGFPSGTSLRVPSAIMTYLALRISGDGESDSDFQDICSRR